MADRLSRQGAMMDRRALLAGGLAMTLAAPAAAAAIAKPISVMGRETVYPAARQWSAEPAQAPAKTEQVMLGDARLRYWDTGGRGPAVILLHPMTGNAQSWPYQQPVLAAQGYRIIGYSRRGFYGSDAGPADRPGSLAEDLKALADYLKVDRFHLVGLAAGGFGVADFALSYPERLLSMTIGSSLGGIVDEGFVAATAALIPPPMSALPTELKELGPSYRASNPAGVARWNAIRALNPERTTGQKPVHRLDWPALESIRVPTLLLTGDADFYMPPARLRQLATHFDNPSLAIIAEAGHAPHWENPDAFNAALLAFFARHSTGATRRRA